MDIREIIKAVQKVSLIIGGILAISLIAGVIAHFTDILTFGVGFGISLIVGVGIWVFVWNEAR